MKKKYGLSIILAVFLAFGVVFGGAVADDSEPILTDSDFQVEYPAAPAVAGELLEAAGVDNRYGTGRDGGNYISAVADNMGPETDFNGVSKEDVHQYEYEVCSFLIGIGADLTCTPQYELLETLTVDSSNMYGENSQTLTDGVDYQFEVSGTWKNRAGTNEEFEVDADYTNKFIDWADFDNLDLQVDLAGVYWGEFNPDHIYYLNFEGQGNSVNFRIFDGETDPISSWYNDNVGSLTVDIYKINW